jgi:hypothetical protein
LTIEYESNEGEGLRVNQTRTRVNQMRMMVNRMRTRVNLDKNQKPRTLLG